MNKNFLRRVSLAELKRKGRPTAISLFSGCGGMDLGMMSAGFEVRVMIDNDKNCCDTLYANFVQRALYRKKRSAPVILHQDITKTSTAELLRAADLQVGEATVVTGGFPCQGFSMANPNRGRHNLVKNPFRDKRNKLYLECVRVVREALPEAFIFENVPGLIPMGKGRVIDMICRDLASCGYDVIWDNLNAADYGVPQIRWRVFFIGTRVDHLYFDCDRPDDPPQLHIGCPGRYKHPDFFMKRYKIPSHWPEDFNGE